jgi:hypothetical protein
MLEQFSPQLVQAVIAKKLDMAKADDEEEEAEGNLLLEQTEAVPYLGRCQYDVTKQAFLSVLDPLLSAYQKLVGGGMPNESDLIMCEKQLA